MNLQGSPAIVRLEGQSGISQNWNLNPPAPGFPRTTFSTRWTRRVYFPGRPYVFYITADDGVRLYIDSTLILDAWRVQAATQYRQVVDLTEGFHVLRVEYFQQYEGALINVTWDPPNGQVPPLPPFGGQNPPPSTGVTGQVTIARYLNVRTGPGVIFGILRVISRGDSFNIVARNADNSWVRISSPIASGWVSTYYISIFGNLNTLPIERPQFFGQPGNVASTGVRGQLLSGLRVRTGPSGVYPQIDELDWGTVIDIVGRTADSSWLQIRYAGTVGWIYGPYVRLVAGSLFNVPITG
jgi:uncharacterized protein YraI